MSEDTVLFLMSCYSVDELSHKGLIKLNDVELGLYSEHIAVCERCWRLWKKDPNARPPKSGEPRLPVPPAIEEHLLGDANDASYIDEA